MKEADCPPRHSPPIFHERPPLSSTTTHLVASYPEPVGIKTTIVCNRDQPSCKTVYLLCPFVKPLIVRKRGIAEKFLKIICILKSNNCLLCKQYIFKKWYKLNVKMQKIEMRQEYKWIRHA